MYAPLPDVVIGTTRFSIALPADPSVITGFRLTNESNTVLPVRVSGQLRNLEPWTQDVWLFPNHDLKAASVQVDAPQLLQPPLLPGSTLKAEIAINEPDPYPGVYPQALTRQVSGLAGLTMVANQKTLLNGAADSITTTAGSIPPTSKALVLVVTAGAGTCAPAASQFLAGVQTGTEYAALKDTANSGVIGIYIFPIPGTLEDTQYKFNFSNGGGATVNVYASDIQPPGISQGQETSMHSIPVVIANDQSAVSVQTTGASTVAAVISGTTGALPTLQPYDGQGTSHPAAGTKATVTLAGNGTKRWIAHDAEVSESTTVATAVERDFNLIDGASGGVNALVVWTLGYSAVIGNTQQAGRAGMAYEGTVSTGMTLEASAADASMLQRVSIGAYLRT